MPPFFMPRRDFLKRLSIITTVSTLPAWVARSAEGEARPKPAGSARPTVALVGCGGMGNYDLKDAAKFADVVALCDVDAIRLKATGALYPQATLHADFREVVRLPRVDAIINGTPDHWHTLINLAAIRAGKDVYSEKPLTLTIDEGLRLVREVKQSRRILQTGSQQRSDRRFRLAVHLVQSGRIGKLRHLLSSLPSGRHGGPFAGSAVPAELNWDVWQGQAPRKEYVKERCHSDFRYWWDYSEGTLTDWGAHHNDIALWGQGPAILGPVSVSAQALRDPVPGGYSFPSLYRVEYTYANGVTHTCQTVSSESPSGGTTGPTPPGQMTNGVLFQGSDGWIYVSRNQIQASQAEILQDPDARADFGPAHESHVGNFFACVASRQTPAASAEVGHRAVSVCHLGAIALRLGHTLHWDPAAERFKGEGAREANRHLSREMRAPYNYSYIA